MTWRRFLWPTGRRWGGGRPRGWLDWHICSSAPQTISPPVKREWDTIQSERSSKNTCNTSMNTNAPLWRPNTSLKCKDGKDFHGFTIESLTIFNKSVLQTKEDELPLTQYTWGSVRQPRSQFVWRRALGTRLTKQGTRAVWVEGKRKAKRKETSHGKKQKTRCKPLFWQTVLISSFCP